MPSRTEMVSTLETANLPPLSCQDILALALAKAETSHVTTNTTRWCEVIRDFRARNEKSAPRFLDDVQFQKTSSSQLKSTQIDRFIEGMRLTRKMVYQLPNTRVYAVPEQSKQEIAKQADIILYLYGCKSFVSEPARDIDQKLAL
ncbi:hypothetical protein HY405_01920 [Candidatus Microgenomates bacterium]|nr:hypothetical protein [Candidatus Microgenomates bacterium]